MAVSDLICTACFLFGRLNVHITTSPRGHEFLKEFGIMRSGIRPCHHCTLRISPTQAVSPRTTVVAVRASRSFNDHTWSLTVLHSMLMSLCGASVPFPSTQQSNQCCIWRFIHVLSCLHIVASSHRDVQLSAIAESTPVAQSSGSLRGIFQTARVAQGCSGARKTSASRVLTTGHAHVPTSRQTSSPMIHSAVADVASSLPARCTLDVDRRLGHTINSDGRGVVFRSLHALTQPSTSQYNDNDHSFSKLH